MKSILTDIQKKTKKILLFTISIGAITACDSVLEFDEGDCSIAYGIIFKYDYNIKQVDAFAQEVKNITLYAFDHNNNLVAMKAESGDMLSTGEYAMSMDIDPEKYHLIAWAGLDDESFAVPLLTPGKSNITDLNVKTIRNSVDVTANPSKSEGDKVKFIVKRELSSLWHGEFKKGSSTRNGRKRFTEVSLLKNTNNIRIALVQVKQNENTPITRAINKDELKFNIYDDNGFMNYDNTLLDDDMLTYKPFMTEQRTVTTRAFSVVDTEYPAVIAELSVARLMKDKNPELSIIDTKTNKSILKTGDLIGYLNLLRIEKYADMPLQEYLDREDNYSMLVFVDESLTLINTVIEINDWVIQLNDFDL